MNSGGSRLALDFDSDANIDEFMDDVQVRVRVILTPVILTPVILTPVILTPVILTPVILALPSSGPIMRW